MLAPLPLVLPLARAWVRTPVLVLPPAPAWPQPRRGRALPAPPQVSQQPPALVLPLALAWAPPPLVAALLVLLLVQPRRVLLLTPPLLVPLALPVLRLLLVPPLPGPEPLCEIATVRRRGSSRRDATRGRAQATRLRSPD